MKHIPTTTLRAAVLRRHISRRPNHQAQIRHYSSSSSSSPEPTAAAKLPPSQQQPSFYKTFSRPIFKVALMAIFTYQLAYYGWVKLETDEIRTDAAATISDLEKRIEVLEQQSRIAADTKGKK